LLPFQSIVAETIPTLRPFQLLADAIEQCFGMLAKKASPQWVSEGDIRACFDNLPTTLLWAVQSETPFHIS
jgi:retron-type reverse transcriptase